MSSTTGPKAPVILPVEDVFDTGHAFLSKTPAQNSSIHVRTDDPHEYQIWVRLPGFTSDGIIVAQRARVLHIVADNWENNGGHFDRRVLFDYDADLSEPSVRAKFHNDWLCVAVRRHPLIHYAPS